MSENRRVFLSKLTLDVQTGVGLTSGQGSDPNIMFRLSTDSGWTWGNQVLLSIGRLGRYNTQVETFRLGYGRNFVFEFSGSDPNTLALINCWVDGEEGTS
jgi:hypothetical protein